MRLCIISDTHNHHAKVHVPECDVLIHCGDLTEGDVVHRTLPALDWLAEQPGGIARILVPGNHDWVFQSHPTVMRHHCIERGITLLVDDYTTVLDLRDGTYLKCYGSPWTPWFHDWAFNFPRDDRDAMALDTWAKIPDDTDILITHGPPIQMLDHTTRGDRAGCAVLGHEIFSRVQPKLHCFGHIHEGYGLVESRTSGITYVNACMLDEYYHRRSKRKPWLLDYEGGEFTVVSE